MLKRTLYYRGRLSSCNYSCNYCPFALKKNSRIELNQDKSELNRFVDWVSEQKEAVLYNVMFTPWGEALIRDCYKQAFVKLSHLPHVYRVCSQTNLSCDVTWLKAACRESSALWVSYHPEEVDFDAFLKKCKWLYQNNIIYSVGMVGLKEYIPILKQLRKKLPVDVYLWVNAFKEQSDYYLQEDIEALLAIDPLFNINHRNYDSYGLQCRTGNTSFLVGEKGELNRCHFVKQPMGNLYDDNLCDILKKELCPNQVCECYLGYVHLNQKNINLLYGDRVLERIPVISK